MFLKDKSKGGSKSKVKRKRKPVAPTIISSDMRITGNLTSEGEVQVDGIVDGDVRGYRPPSGWSARADLTDIHPITGRALPRAVWWIIETKK